MKKSDQDVIIVGAGLAGLSCARRLLAAGIPFVILEAGHRIDSAEAAVRGQLTDWFGVKVRDWRHLKTYRIQHALPLQPPPMPDPTAAVTPTKPGIFVCGEYGSVPGIQWAMLSGRHAAEAVLNALGKDG